MYVSSNSSVFHTRQPTQKKEKSFPPKLTIGLKVSMGAETWRPSTLLSHLKLPLFVAVWSCVRSVGSLMGRSAGTYRLRRPIQNICLREFSFFSSLLVLKDEAGWNFACPRPFESSAIICVSRNFYLFFPSMALCKRVAQNEPSIFSI